MQLFSFTKVFITGMACLTFSTTATALDDPGNGKAIAERWCAPCHLVSPDQERGSADVPPFAAIAGKPDETLNRLQDLLSDPHPAMPALNLTRQEAKDLAAYIRSLR